MSHEFGLESIVPPVLIMILTGTLTVLFFRKRRETSVHALDWMIAIFGSVFLLGFFQSLKVLFHDKTVFFVGSEAPLASDIVTITHLTSLLILYFMVESFLAERPNPLRLAGLTVLVTLFFSLAIYYQSTGDLVKTSEVLGFANDTNFDAFIFNVIQVSVLILVLYTFYMQYILSDNTAIRRFLRILLLAILLFFVTAIFELLEHIFDVPEVSAFLFALPTFMILAVFYIRNANFIYLAPANIAFLQIVTTEGQLLYAAELTEDLTASDFLIAPSLSSVGSIISELVNKEEQQIRLKQFVYEGGYILFEQIGNIRAILQTDRPSQILKRSMRYFLREFHKLYADQVKDYKGYITPADGISPDLLFATAIPIVQSKQMTSNFSSNNPTK